MNKDIKIGELQRLPDQTIHIPNVEGAYSVGVAPQHIHIYNYPQESVYENRGGWFTSLLTLLIFISVCVWVYGYLQNYGLNPIESFPKIYDQFSSFNTSNIDSALIDKIAEYNSKSGQ